MVLSNIELYELLIEMVGKTEAKAITEYIGVEEEKKVEDKISMLATKQDLSDLEVRITKNVFIGNVVQFLATVGSVLPIVAFIMKK